MLEFDLKETDSAKMALDAAKRVLNSSGAVFRDTDEPDLLWIQIANKKRHGNSDIYLDCENPRYWLLHGTGDGDAIAEFLLRQVRKHSILDHAWIPSDMIETFTNTGLFRGFRLSFNRNQHKKLNTDTSLDQLSMGFWGSQAKRTLGYIKGSPELKNGIALAKIKVRLTDNNEDLYSDGRVTARGSSFVEHLAFVKKVYLDTYAPQIRKIEQQYALHLQTDDDGQSFLRGEPIVFSFDKKIDDLAAFCEDLFSSGEPYLLWGNPTLLSSNYYRVQAVDLHVGSQLAFEIFPDFVRVYLPRKSCGNTILRLYTNLQHHYDALVKVTDAAGGPLLAF